MRLWHTSGLTIALLLVPMEAAAEWQFKPFLGVTFAPSTNLLGDLEFAAGSGEGPESGSANLAIGVSATLIGEIFGIEGEFADAPGFFQAGDEDEVPIGGPPSPQGNLVLSSRAQTFMGNVVVAMPRRLSQYTLRPYLVGGAGVMRLRSVDGVAPVSGLFSIRETLAAIDVGGGASGFFNERIGVGWDLRYFRSVGGEPDPLATIDGLAKQLSFWRAHMALVLRY